MATQVGLTLIQAWKVHWGILFPEEPNCEVALRNWVMSSLVHFCPDKPFLPRQKIDCAIPDWLSKLDVHFDIDGARIGLEQTPQQVAPWFANTLLEWKPRWVRGHADHVQPLERLAATPQEDKVNHDRWSKESYDALRNVTLRIGKRIAQELHFKLRAGHLHATGINSKTELDMGGTDLVRRLNDGYQLNVLNNSMFGSENRPTINSIRISRGPFHDRKMKWPHSFEEYDIALLERMKEMIETGQVSSVRKAAEAYADLALRKGEKDSVIQRLEREYGHWIGS